MQCIKNFLLFFSFFIVFNCLCAQSNTGINYKAIIKDDIGNVIANQSIQIEFTIVYGISQSIAYHEMQSTTTDSNGFINVIIGDGELIDDGDFETIGEVQWQFDTHYLNVKIDSGDGFIDLGTTQLGAVPYALHAKFADNAFSGNYNDLNNRPTIIYPSGLEKVTENNGLEDKTGWRLIGVNPDNYGTIGNNAIDLSYSNSNLEPYGATGNFSTAFGVLTTAKGIYSTAIGLNSIARSTVATAIGTNTYAGGQHSTAIGYGAESDNFSATSIGFNTKAFGSYSLATGSETIASGSYSMTLGYGTMASGDYSLATGYATKAESFRSMATGYFNIGGGDSNSWVSTDPLFEIGNGSSDSDRTNALTVYKDGTMFLDRKNFSRPNLILGGTSDTAGGDNCIIASDPNYAGSDLFLRSNDAVVIELDKDNNEEGQFEVRNSSGTIIFEVNESGNATLSGSLTQNSDVRLKEDIVDLPYGLNEILKMQPKAYHWKNHKQNRKSIGLIAQDVQQIIKEIVNEQDDPSQTLGISYNELIPVLINAIKEQQKIITSQNIKLSEQDAKLAKLTQDHEKFLRRLRRLEQSK